MLMLKTMLLLSLPLVISGVLHMMVVRFDLFQSLKKPLHQKLFGKNKTYRGLLVIPVTAALGTLLTASIQESLVGFSLFQGFFECLFLGLFLGLAYAVGELPNSYWKRQKGIQEGKSPKEGKFLHTLVDQGDSAVFCVAVYAFYYDQVTVILAALTVLFGIGVHLSVNLLLYILHLRKEPF